MDPYDLISLLPPKPSPEESYKCLSIYLSICLSIYICVYIYVCVYIYIGNTDLNHITQTVHVATHVAIGNWVIVIMVWVLGKYVIIRYLDP